MSIIIIVVGVQLGLESIDKIMNPQPVDAGAAAHAGARGLHLREGLYVCLQPRHRLEDKFPGMAATAMDSLSDSIATSVVLVSMLLSRSPE